MKDDSGSYAVFYIARIIFMSMYKQHCVGRTRKHRSMYYEFGCSCELWSQILAGTLVIFGTWVREEMVRNLL